MSNTAPNAKRLPGELDSEGRTVVGLDEIARRAAHSVGNDDLEKDEPLETSRAGDAGTWVHAWVYVPDANVLDDGEVAEVVTTCDEAKMVTHGAALLRARSYARKCGSDVGLYWNEMYQVWSFHELPKPEARSGWELCCEVVRPV